MSDDKDYVLGTHDEEISRLGLQHRVWRPRALDAWRRANFTVGQTLLDIGCGPGFATLDLAEIVGPSGRVIAIDRSHRFIAALQAALKQHELNNVTEFELDLDEADFPSVSADGAWCRWVFTFVKKPRDLLARVSRTLKTGAPFVIHEYFHYSTWRLSPRSPEHEEFVRIVMEAWRADGGEPDIGLALPIWLNDLGFEIKSMLPIVDVISPSNFVWQWPKSFVQSGLRRLVDLGSIQPERAEEILESFMTLEKQPNTLMITPGVLEIVAIRR
jgi:SAM-dependent methyltransferase